MPIIIDEVIITVMVGNAGQTSSTGSPPGPVADTRAIVNECVERVLEILARKEER